MPDSCTTKGRCSLASKAGWGAVRSYIAAGIEEKGPHSQTGGISTKEDAGEPWERKDGAKGWMQLMVEKKGRERGEGEGREAGTYPMRIMIIYIRVGLIEKDMNK